MAVKASDNFKVYENPNGPKVSTVTRKIIEKAWRGTLASGHKPR